MFGVYLKIHTFRIYKSVIFSKFIKSCDYYHNTALEDGANIDMPVSVDWVADEDVPELDDYAYSFALVGDTQIVSKNDALNGTNDLANMYQYIIDKKDDYKIAQVIGLGDIVDTYADGAQKENEWNVATSAISR